MAEEYQLPSQSGKQIVIDDAQSLAVLRGIDKNFSGVIKTDEDYFRTVFYFRAAGLKEDIKNKPEYKKYEGLFDNKENVDLLFKCLFSDSKRIDEMLNLDDKYIPLSIAFTFMQNDVLYSKYEDETPHNNMFVQKMAKINILKPYLDSKIFKDTYYEVYGNDTFALLVLQKVRQKMAQKHMNPKNNSDMRNTNNTFVKNKRFTARDFGRYE